MGERPTTSLNLVRDTSEMVDLIRKCLLADQNRQKSYANRWRRPLEFEVGDHVFFKVMLKIGVVRFGKWGKLSPRYIEPFKILERVGTVAYRLALPPNLSGVHVIFMFPYSRSTLQIRLMWWIRASLLLMRMEPSRRDQYVSWIVGNRFYEVRL